VETGEAALALAQQGDERAEAAFGEAATALQGAIEVITGLLDVSEVRIGGGFGLAGGSQTLLRFGGLFGRSRVARGFISR